MTVAITRVEPDAAGLRQAAARTKDADAARRMLALAFVLDGRSRVDAAQSCGMDRQTLRDWVHRFNERGLAGLSDRKAPGPMPRLTPEQNAAVVELVRKGPDLAEHGVVRWRRADLSKVIQARFGVQLAERSVGTLLRRLGFRHLSVRPHNPVQDLAAMEAHKKTSPNWSPPQSQNTHVASRSSSGGRTKPGSVSRAR